MKKYVFMFPVNLPGVNWCVVSAEVPAGSVDIYDSFGAPKRNFWTDKKLFKNKINAEKRLNKIYKEQRSFNLTQKLVDAGLFSFN